LKRRWLTPAPLAIEFAARLRNNPVAGIAGRHFRLLHDFSVATVLAGLCKGNLAMWMIILGALLVLAAATGAAAWSAVSTVRATIAEVLSLLSLAGAAGFMLFDVGPRFQELDIGFGVELPVVTIWALRVLYFTPHEVVFLIGNLIGSGRRWHLFLRNPSAAGNSAKRQVLRSHCQFFGWITGSFVYCGHRLAISATPGNPVLNKNGRFWFGLGDVRRD
jgi:hypothetical protein